MPSARGRKSRPGEAFRALPSAVDLVIYHETELKLTCRDPAQLDAVAKAPVLASASTRRVRQLDSLYYDTEALTLRRAGYTLRVRDDGDRHILTVKAQREPGHLTRYEREETLLSAAIDREVLARLLPSSVLETLGRSPIRPLFSTRIEREEVTIDFAGATIEVAMDRGQIVAGERIAPVIEVELELRRGSVGALYQLALELSKQAPLVPSARTKSDRGFALGFDARLPAVLPSELELSGRMSLDEALGAIFNSGLAQAIESLPRAADPDDPEGIHQIRVALRRLRMAFWLVRRIAPSKIAEVLSREAGWLAAQLGDARDWDVLANEIVPAAAEGGLESCGFEALRLAIEPQRRRAHEKAGDAVSTVRTGRFLLSLGLWASQHGWDGDGAPDTRARLAKPVRKMAKGGLSALHRKVLRRGRKFNSLDLEGRHKLRIALKKLRYAADLFLPAVQTRDAARHHIAMLIRLQDDLGQLNDAARASELLAELTGAAISKEANRAIGIVLGFEAARLKEREASLHKSWSDFTKAFQPGPARKSRRD